MSKKYKILQLNNRIPFPLNDGGNIATYQVTKHLHAAGHQVIFAALNTLKHHQDPRVMYDVCDMHAVSIDTSITASGIIKGFFQSTPYNIHRFYSDEYAELIAHILQHNDIDIVQVEGIYMGIYLPVIKKHTTAPVILRSHNIEHQIWERLSHRISNPLKKWYLRYLYKKIKAYEYEVMHEFDGIMAITSLDEKFYRNAGYHRPLTTLTPGVECISVGQEDYPEKMNDICMLGSLEWQPNIDGLKWLLREVWPEVVEKIPGAHLHVAGKNPSASVLSIQQKGVTIHGEVENAQHFLEKSPILVVPLHSGGGMRIKILEGMALGKCVVTTSIGAEGIHVEHGKNIIIADHAETFIASLTALFSDPQKVKSIGLNAIANVKEHYVWDKKIEELTDFYKKVIHK